MSDSFLIGFSNLSNQQIFAQIVRDSLIEAVGATPDLELIIRDNDFDNDRALENAHSFADMGVDLAMVYHIDERFNPELYQVLLRAGIPVIGIDIPVSLGYYFGANNPRAGQLLGDTLGQWVQQYWHGTLDKLLVVTDSRLLGTVRQRMEVAVQVLGEYINIHNDNILFVDGANRRGEAARVAHRVLGNWAEHTKIGVLGLNDDGTKGVIDAATSLGCLDHIVCAGHGITDLAAVFSNPDNRIVGSVAYYPERYGAGLVDYARSILAGESVPRQRYMDHVVITPDNYWDYI